jgi:hypothetical protein
MTEAERLKVAEEARIKDQMERDQRRAVEQQRGDLFAEGWESGSAAVIAAAREAAATNPNIKPSELIARLVVVFGK